MKKTIDEVLYLKIVHLKFHLYLVYTYAVCVQIKLNINSKVYKLMRTPA